MTQRRTVPCPTWKAPLMLQPWRTNRSMYPARVVQSTSRPYSSSTLLFTPSRATPFRGPLPLDPHWQTNSVVTPWCTIESAVGFAMNASSEWLCMSMKPGETTSPFASITASASEAGSRVFISAILPASTATSALYQGAPVPSTTKPFFIR